MKKPFKFKVNGKIYGIDILSILFLVICLAAVILGSKIILKQIRESKVEEEEVVETPVSDDPDDLYNVEEFAIELDTYKGTILERTENAGRSYVEETLFIGDTNVARFLRFENTDGLPFTDLENTIGVVGLSVDDLEALACLDTSKGRMTIPEAITALQPKRILLNVGLYDLLEDREQKVETYRKAIKAMVDAYPSVDVIVNAIAPVAKNRAYKDVTMQEIDQWNQALVKMCQEEGYKFLNSSEALRDEDTGFAKDEFVEEDGAELSERGLVALFEYIRMHAHITDDDRPTPLNVVPKVIGVQEGLIAINALNGEPFEDLPEVESTPTPTPTPVQQTTPQYVQPAEPVATPTPEPTPEAEVTPTPETQGEGEDNTTNNEGEQPSEDTPQGETTPEEGQDTPAEGTEPAQENPEQPSTDTTPSEAESQETPPESQPEEPQG